MELRLANGIIIDTETGQAITPAPSPDAVSLPKTDNARKNVRELGRDKSNRNIRVGLHELPADTKACTTAGIVYFYHMMGLSDLDIATATGLKLSQVEMVKGLDLFTQIDARIRENITKLDFDSMRSRISEAAKKSMNVMEDALDDDELDMKTKIKVAKDMLDRDGHRAADIVEHRHKMEGGLVIRVVEEKKQPDNLPNVHIDKSGAIDVEPE